MEFLTAYSCTLECPKGSSNGNDDFLSQLPEEATDRERSCGSLTPSAEDEWMYFIRSCGFVPSGHQAGVGLGGLVPSARSSVLEGLPPCSADLVTSASMGRALVLLIPELLRVSGLFEVYPRLFLVLRSTTAGVFPVENATEVATRVSSRSGASFRRSLDPADLISTRGLRRSAGAAGVPRPAVD